MTILVKRQLEEALENRTNYWRSAADSQKAAHNVAVALAAKEKLPDTRTAIQVLLNEKIDAMGKLRAECDDLISVDHDLERGLEIND